MKNFAGIVVGVVVAVAIGCAARSKSSQAPAATPGEPGVPGAPGATVAEPSAGLGAFDRRGELDRLDQAISADMNALALTRPTPPPLTCTAAACADQMSGAAATATAPPAPDCRPAPTQTCTDSCNLKSSICDNAGRICKIAADLGGTDAYANDLCNRGTASCEAAKQRCCRCL